MKYIMKRIEYLMSLFLVVAILAVPINAWADVEAYISIEDQTVDIGDQLIVEVLIEGADDLHAFGFDLLFNPNILQVKNAEYSDLLSRGGADEVEYQEMDINNTDGKISQIKCSRVTPDGISAAGVLIKVIFDTVRAGKSVLKLDNVTLTNSAEESVKSGLYEGEITVYPPNGKITGVVTDAFGPVRRADVVALQEGISFGIPGRTDKNGRYIIDNIPNAGIYDVLVTHSDYLPTTISNVEVRIGMTTSNVNATLLPPTKLYTKVDYEGFIRDWLLLGPIPWDDKATRLGENQLSATENKPSGTKEKIHKVLTPREGDRGSGLAQALRWTLHNSQDRYINLESVYREQGKRYEKTVTYAFTSVKSPGTQPVSLLVGSADGIAVWVNHELVHSNDVSRGASPDQDTISNLTLKEGWNSILIKCVNETDGWGFFARFVSQKPFAMSEPLTTLKVAPESQELQVTLGESSFVIHLNRGLHNIALPLRPKEPFTARSFAEKLGATFVIDYDEATQEFFAFLPNVATTDGFTIRGGYGYIVNLPAAVDVTFSGQPWSNAAPSYSSQSAKKQECWAFVVGGIVDSSPHRDYPEPLTVTITNQRTDTTATSVVGSAGKGRYTTAFVDMTQADVVRENDLIQITVKDATGTIVAGPIRQKVQEQDLRNAYLLVNPRLGNIIPTGTRLRQNYPNPFNPETWIPYELAESSDVTIRIYDVQGRLVREFALGHQPAGVYVDKAHAVHWDGTNAQGERVGSGIYCYQLDTENHSFTRRMVVVK